MKILFKRNWATFLSLTIVSGAILAAFGLSVAGSFFGRKQSSYEESTRRLAGGSGLNQPEMIAVSPLDKASPSAVSPQGEGEKTDRLVIKNKYLQITVSDLRKSIFKIDQIAKEFGGYTFSSNIYSDLANYPLERGTSSAGPALSGNIVIKVVAENLSDAVDALKLIGKVESEGENASEVTEQHIDLSARLKNYRAQEGRYLEIFASAKTVEDMIKIEEALTRVRGEIESIKSQIDYLDRSVAMATISLDLSEPRSAAEPIFDWSLRDSLRRVSKNLVAIIDLLVVLIGTLLPLVLIGLFGWKAYLKFKERGKKS